MDEKKLTYADIEPYTNLFSKVPSLILGGMIKKNSNLVLKFKSRASSYLGKLNSKQKEQLNIVLESDIEDLQALLAEAYDKTGKKQFKQLADSGSKEFIKINLDELRKLVG